MKSSSRKLGKYDIVNFLLRKYELSSFIEFCTPTTGRRISELTASLAISHRLMYRCPADFDDGLRIEFRSQSVDISHCIEDIRRREQTYDLVFIDPFHTYECTARDMATAISILKPGGIIVIHDCNPGEMESTNPEFQAGAWCGQTYAAYVDFVLSQTAITYYTVDTDYGCGVIKTQPGTRPDDQSMLVPRCIAQQWRSIGEEYRQRFRFFESNKKQLLNLVPVGRFVAIEMLVD